MGAQLWTGETLSAALCVLPCGQDRLGCDKGHGSNSPKHLWNMDATEWSSYGSHLQVEKPRLRQVSNSAEVIEVGLKLGRLGALSSFIHSPIFRTNLLGPI